MLSCRLPSLLDFNIIRICLQVLAMWGVLRFYNLVRAGITWRGPEAKTAIFAPMYKSVSKSAAAAQLQAKRSKRRYSVEVESGCCAIFDFDFDYDEEQDDDDDDAQDSVGFDYDDYYEYYEDQDEQQLELDDADCSMLGAKPRRAAKSKTQRQRRTNNNIRSVLINKRHNKYKISRPQTQLEVINESERSAGSGSDENDSLLVAYDSSSSLASV
ncbi:CG32204 [Drosophila busckii]|uniref:CG32204 n=1 Tax=Drosophila busckii TaxID=30019 RepID=A0A0M3QW81_DROBS|nr:CG32204 [Drosophila busckii]